MLLCEELEDEIVGTAIEARFYRSFRTFYETAVCKIIAKFPFNDTILKKLRMLGIASLQVQLMCLTWQIIYLCHDTDLLTMEYRSCTDDELPQFDPRSDAAIDHFWADIGDIKTVTDLDLEVITASESAIGTSTFQC